MSSTGLDAGEASPGSQVAGGGHKDRILGLGLVMRQAVSWWEGGWSDRSRGTMGVPRTLGQKCLGQKTASHARSS